ncbi:ABC-type cobalamin/Fe3+-siderophore transport system, ATPase component [Mesorhizobium plurifarium]|uniref:ABC-type cobalamin/Fe3+-siderophore transport system, ATPase component n=1 Tax=Mesorhizobium plurifarium TaxID=69974 RepID=A0A0K2VZI1_MESPL|nr:ABC-type cobalamin/Fe3+-siderophore transport system, ATPase component [Mesorhizobium plurifarium]
MIFSGRRARRTLFACMLTCASPVTAAPGTPVEIVEISARPITQFHTGHDETRFGPLEFVGGLEMTSPGRDFGALSAFRFLKPGGDFIGVADTGFWFFGTITHDAGKRPSGVSNFRVQQMVDASGRPVDRKWEVDAEGLAVKDGIATVGFERDQRVAQFKIDPDNMKAPVRQLDYLVPAGQLRQNRGFETVAHADPYGQHEGGLVVVSERSLDTSGNVYAAVIEGSHKGVFTVRRDGGFDITDGAFLPDGDLLLLERSFSIARGVKMRLRRIYGESVEKSAVADGPVLMEADMGYQIDNMEGLDVWTRDDGALMVSLVSDDNHSILQRNLYLEFILHQD